MVTMLEMGLFQLLLPYLEWLGGAGERRQAGADTLQPGDRDAGSDAQVPPRVSDAAVMPLDPFAVEWCTFRTVAQPANVFPLCRGTASQVQTVPAPHAWLSVGSALQLTPENIRGDVSSILKDLFSDTLLNFHSLLQEVNLFLVRNED
jgi:hypothetical protein